MTSSDKAESHQHDCICCTIIFNDNQVYMILWTFSVFLTNIVSHVEAQKMVYTNVRSLNYLILENSVVDDTLTLLSVESWWTYHFLVLKEYNYTNLWFITLVDDTRGTTVVFVAFPYFAQDLQLSLMTLGARVFYLLHSSISLRTKLYLFKWYKSVLENVIL